MIHYTSIRVDANAFQIDVHAFGITNVENPMEAYVYLRGTVLRLHLECVTILKGSYKNPVDVSLN